MHAPIKYVEKGMAVAANGLWQVFSIANHIRQNPSFTPRWSDKPLLKSWQKTKPPLGWPRETDSLCPTCVREARQSILDGRQDVLDPADREGGRNQGHHRRARRQDPDDQGLSAPRALRRRHGDRPGDVQAPRGIVPGARHPGAQRREAAQPWQQHGEVRPRLGADGGPHQSLQHDVRPVLHGRQPGRLRARAAAGRTSRRSSTTRSRSSRSARCRCSSRAVSRRSRRIFLDAVAVRP